MIQGKFRADLWYRLNTFRIAIPPLRERLEDRPLLVEFLLGELTANRLVPQIASDFSEELLRRSWPGNVRELRQALESALILAQGRELRAEHLPPIPTDFPLLADIGADIEGMLTTWLQSRWNEPHEGEQKDERDGIYMEFLKAFETPFLQNVLERCGGNCARAAQILGMHRTTLREKLRRS